jgi:hypothetical protein
MDLSRLEVESRKTVSNSFVISQALANYYKDHHQNLPQKLVDLYPDYLVSQGGNLVLVADLRRENRIRLRWNR